MSLSNTPPETPFVRDLVARLGHSNSAYVRDLIALERAIRDHTEHVHDLERRHLLEALVIRSELAVGRATTRFELRLLRSRAAELAPRMLHGRRSPHPVRERDLPLSCGDRNRANPMRRANAIRVIHPYRWNGLWVFDDPDVGLVREPFVAGMPEIIDYLVRDIPDAGLGFNMLWSDRPFPGAKLVLEREREQEGGNWYRWIETGAQGWLCPALLLYFNPAPKRLYIDVKAVNNQEPA
jgi:hypothetical protein